MRKRCLSILLVLALCLAWFPVPVHALGETFYVDTYLDALNNVYDSFGGAVVAAGDADTIVLRTDVSEEFNEGDAGETYNLDLNGHSFDLTGGLLFKSNANWLVKDSQGGGEFKAEALVLEGPDQDFNLQGDNFVFTVTDSLTMSGDNAVFSVLNTPTDIATLTLGGDSAQVRLNGGTQNIQDLAMAGVAANAFLEDATFAGTLQFSGSNAILETTGVTFENETKIIMAGDGPSVTITNSEGTIERIDIAGESPNLAFDGSELQIAELVWYSDSMMAFANSNITVTGLFNAGYGTLNAAQLLSFEDNNSSILLEATNNIASELDAGWLANQLSPLLPAHFSLSGAEGSGGGVTIYNKLPFKAAPEEDPFVDPITLKNTFETAAFESLPDLASAFESKSYNAQEQYLFAKDTVEGGTAYYCLDTTAATPVWTSNGEDIAETEAVSYPNAAVWIAGDAEHEDSAREDGTVAITPLEVTVVIKGNSETVQYDGTEHTVAGYTMTSSSSDLYGDTDFYYDKGGSELPSVSRTDVGTTEMGLQDDIDSGYFINASDNFAVTFELEEDGFIEISELPEAQWDTPPEAVSDLTETGEPLELIIEGIPEPDNGTPMYSLDDGATWSEDIPTAIEAGEYTVSYYIKGAENKYLDGGEGSVTATIAEMPVAQWATEPEAATDLSYTGEPLELVAAGVPETGHGTAMYSLDGGTTWSGDIPTGTEVSTYTVSYYIQGTAGAYQDSAVGTVEVEITSDLIAKYYISASDGASSSGQEYTWTYDGTAHSITGVPEDGMPEMTIQYRVDGGDWSGNAPTITDAGQITVDIRSESSNANYAPVLNTGFTLIVEPKEAVIMAVDKNVAQGQAAPTLTDDDYTIEGLVADTKLADSVFIFYGDDPTNPIAAENVDTSAAGTVPIGIELEGANANYQVEIVNGTLTINAAEEPEPEPSDSGGRASRSESPAVSNVYNQPTSGVGSGKVTLTTVLWGDRGNFSIPIADTYKVLTNNSISAAELQEGVAIPYPGIEADSFLTQNETFELPQEDPAVERVYHPDTAMVAQADEPVYTANGDGRVDESTFNSSNFYNVGLGSGDSKIDYPNLKTGDVVSNSTFNGIFVTSLVKSGNANFDSQLAKLKDDAIASFRAFELDHPEVFWLTGSVKLRVLTVTINGNQTAYMFMTLVDDSGFSMRMPDYAAAGAIEAGIAQRDAAAAAIIAQIPAGASVREKVANLNKWFTLHNEYNRSADLNSIGTKPHRSLAALTGNVGTSGPVCDGYSRAFKMICDRIGIPAILDTGVANSGNHSELHMWNRIQVDGVWYGMDCTWDDPIVAGKDGAVSGYENENYLLVGDSTVVNGMAFGTSHPSNKAAGGTTGVLFATLMMNSDAIDGYNPLQFEDVRLGDWFHDYVKKAAELKLMGGTSEGVFSPQSTATRGQIVQILYNAAGQPAVDEVKVEGWFGKAATWAMDKGIVAGYADGQFHGEIPITREQLATILWAYEGAPAQDGSLEYADAAKVSSYAVAPLLWATKECIIGGKPGNLADPQGTATRAEIATIFSNYMK